MKRQIKFRGKSLNNGEWFYGNLFIGDVNDRVRISTTERGSLNIDPDTVGQFTGLHDKNGKEIYEGDIINFTFHSDMPEHSHLENRPEITRPQIVEFYDCRYILHDFTLDKGNVTCFTFPISDNFRHRYEFIGNIHDNPELLEGGKQ